MERPTMWHRFADWFVKGMKNGLKMTIAINILILGGIVAILLQFQSFQKHTVDLAVSEVVVTNAPAAAGTSIEWTHVICNKSDTAIEYGFTVHLTNDKGAEEALPAMLSGTAEPGCHPQNARSTRLTTTITPGDWTLKVVAYYTPSGGLLSLIPAGISQPFAISGGDADSGN